MTEFHQQKKQKLFFVHLNLEEKLAMRSFFQGSSPELGRVVA
jgi:hypothetical protein